MILFLAVFTMTAISVNAQNKVDKNKKSRYYQNNTTDPEEFHIDGFEKNYDKRNDRDDVEDKSDDPNYNVKIKSQNEIGKYQGERKVNRNRPTLLRNRKDRPVVAKKENNVLISKERVIYMSGDEADYATTVVRKRYTSLDILADDLDVSKFQRPVFKGICSECDVEVDKTITDKNMSSLDKNYKLKQLYMLRDKRLREVLDVQQYKKWLRIKDDDEYLILTKDPELKDGVYK